MFSLILVLDIKSERFKSLPLHLGLIYSREGFYKTSVYKHSSGIGIESMAEIQEKIKIILVHVCVSIHEFCKNLL